MHGALGDHAQGTNRLVLPGEYRSARRTRSTAERFPYSGMDTLYSRGFIYCAASGIRRCWLEIFVRWSGHASLRHLIILLRYPLRPNVVGQDRLVPLTRPCRLPGHPRVPIPLQEVQRLQQVIVNVGGMLKVQSLDKITQPTCLGDINTRLKISRNRDPPFHVGTH